MFRILHARAGGFHNVLVSVSESGSNFYPISRGLMKKTLQTNFFLSKNKFQKLQTRTLLNKKMEKLILHTFQNITHLMGPFFVETFKGKGSRSVNP